MYISEDMKKSMQRNMVKDVVKMRGLVRRIIDKSTHTSDAMFVLCSESRLMVQSACVSS